MTTELVRFTQWSRTDPNRKYTSLMGMAYNGEGLYESFQRLQGNKAPGVDGMRKVDYAEGAAERIAGLSARLRRMAYRPKPVRRVYIPKASGGRRPLGIPSFEDRIVQDRLSQILQAVWEPEFCDCSFGFRPGRSAHDALHKLAYNLTYERTNFVVEADIKGFFTHVDHNHMLRFLEHRIKDPRVLRLIRRFLKAGVMEDGVVSACEEGTPQGGLVSPVLSNVYLHYVLDLWFTKRLAKACRGSAHLVRYADDFVACFQYRGDAERFLKELNARLAAFGLEVEPSKTRLIEFGRYAEMAAKRNGRRPETFAFLGFTHYVTRSRTGRFLVGRRSDGARLRRKLTEVSLRLRSLRTRGGRAMHAYVQQHLRGHIQYYGVSGNYNRLKQYVRTVQRLLFKWLNRRGQRRSVTWVKYSAALKAGLLPRPRVVHNLYPTPPWKTQTGSRMV
jgi:RNA-directed DNA polymerase